MRDGGREPADGAGPEPVVQWRFPLTGSVSYQPGRHGRASQTAAALKLGRNKTERKKYRSILFLFSEVHSSHKKQQKICSKNTARSWFYFHPE